MSAFMKANCLFLLAFTNRIFATELNETNWEEIRQPKVTGRIIKVYSGTKPDPMLCTEEGFKPDPKDCSIFYRCVNSGRGKFSVLRFNCGPGTVYDPETEVCNHPRSTTRSDCNGGLFNIIPERLTQSQENEIDNNLEQSPPSPINIIEQFNPQKTTKRHSTTTTANQPIQRLTQTTVKSIIILNAPKHDDICTNQGFVGDTENCRKFYRCVSNGRGGFIRYEFYCSDTTMWDDDIQGCNHAWAVKRRRCGRGSDEQTNEPVKIKKPVTYLPPQFGNRIDNKNTSQSIDPKATTQNTNTPKQTIQPPKQSSSTTQKVTTSVIKVFDRQSYGGDTDDDNDDNQTSQTTTTTTTTRPSTTSNGNKPSNNECTSSGFMGDSNDCKKFYRCVDNGKGSYTKYEFSCGEGTVWDPKIEACNHPWAVKDCGGSSSMETSNNTQASTSTTSTTLRTTQATESTKTTTDSEDYDDSGYNNNSQPPKSTTTEQTQTTKPNQNQNSNDICTKSGFVGDKNDCKKFYRCVDNGKGSYTKYEFSCGDGTVWDPKIEGCNHEWAVEECGESSQDINKVTTADSDSTSNSGTTSSSTTIAVIENDDDNVGYGSQESNTDQESTTSTARPPTVGSTNDNNNVCTTDGFMGDKNDCKKFYRCVNDGKGGYTRFEFACGEGTVWDSEIDACNHESAVKNCGQSGSMSEKPTTNQDSTTEKTTTEKSIETERPTSGSSTTTSSSSSSTSTSSGSDNSVCTKDGFMGDNLDCKKFYRCVNNERGGFTKYEFTCGEGTVWDQEIQGCNHPSTTKKCGGTAEESNSQNTDQEQQSDEIDNEQTDLPTPNSTTTSTMTSQTTKQPSMSSKGQCKEEGFYGEDNDCMKFYRCVDDGRGGYTKYDFTCGEGTVWDQEIQGCNHASSNSNCSKGTQGAQTTSEPSNQTTESTKTTTSAPGSVSTQDSTQGSLTSSSNNDECTSEGFFGNSKDCKKFYRCVDNGKGGYTKYDFSCGQGTVWVQEIQACDHDNDVGSCTAKESGSSLSSTTASSSTEQFKQPDHEDDEVPPETTTTSSSASSSSSTGKCTSEGYYGNENDCKKFYRCVDNGKGGYTKYDFTCGEGTAWDEDIQGCNHENQVKTCGESNQSQSQKPSDKEDQSSQTQKPDEEGQSESSHSSTESTSTTKSDSGTTSSGCSSDKCQKEGYFGNSQDCKKFYRCVDNGNGGLTKYDFDCGEGTIWDQDVQTCNHPGDVANPSCKDGGTSDCGNGGDGENGGDGGDSGGGDTDSGSKTTSSTTQSSGSSSTSDGTTQSSSNCTEDSSKKPSNITCPKAGFYPNPDDCKKFYRCVDWDGDGQRYSVFHFDCGEGTIWDPELDTCNYEDSVYPPRDCSNKQSASETETSSTTTEGTTTTEKDETTTQQQTTQEQTTQEQTTQKQTTQSQTTQEQTTQEQTTQKQTTQEQTTQEQTTQEQTTQKQTTQEQTTQEQTTQEQTTQKQTTQEQTTQEQTTQEQTTQEQTTQEQTTQEQTTQEQTTEENTTTESTTTTTTESSTTTTEESTTEESTTEQSTTEQSTTEQSTTEQSTTEQSTTEQSTTEQSTTDESTTEQSTTEESTTETSTESSSNKDCPETDDDQYMYVCPTGFRRHPKYCNMFYQCDENENHEVKIATFQCPNNTIYDESKTQCVEESEADKKCDGEMAERRRFKRLDIQKDKSPILVSKNKRSCPAAGHYPFEKNDECSPAFLKCIKSKSGAIRGLVYRCPENHIYWSISRRCEPISKIRNCKNIDNSWSKRWEIPMETKNVAK